MYIYLEVPHDPYFRYLFCSISIILLISVMSFSILFSPRRLLTILP